MSVDAVERLKLLRGSIWREQSAMLAMGGRCLARIISGVDSE
jgi:hypothetical protein